MVTRVRSLAASLMFATACASHHRPAATDLASHPVDAAPPARVLPLRHIDDLGHYGSPLRAIVTDSVALRHVWSLVHGGGSTPPPQVDFTSEMVLLVALGAQPTTGWGIRVDSVTTSSPEVTTAFVSISVPEGCVEGPAFTLPMDAVIVQRPGRGNLLASFAEQVHQRKCQPFKYDEAERARLRRITDSLRHQPPPSRP